MPIETPQPELPPLPPPLPPPEIDPELLDPDALKVIARLRRRGYSAYFVGGCVRDLLLGARPKDYDVATDAQPEEIRAIFRNSRLIGRRFRLAHVFFPGGKIIEVATFRGNPLASTEAGTGEGASEDLLVTDDNQYGTAEEDARRRDFTVNGLFYEVQEGRVIDYVGGRADLEARLVRTIGDPEIRFREDPVRGLRAARIAARLGLSLHPDTFAAMANHAGELPRCAPARVLEEMLKILRSGTSRGAFVHLRETGLLRVLLPPIERVLERGGPEREADFYGRLGALDSLLAEGRRPSDAVMLATLLSFLPLHDPAGDHAGPGFDQPEAPADNVLPTADRVLAQMSAQARLPRRVADRVRLVISSQRHLLHVVKKRRRRSGAGFVRAPHFTESLELLELLVRATGQHAETLERWRQRAAQWQQVAAERGEDEGEAEDEVSGPAPEPAPRGESRRRRSGERRPTGAAAPSPAAPSPAAPSPGALSPAAGAEAEGAAASARGQAPEGQRRRRRGGRRRRKPGAARAAGAPAGPGSSGGSGE